MVIHMYILLRVVRGRTMDRRAKYDGRNACLAQPDPTWPGPVRSFACAGYVGVGDNLSYNGERLNKNPLS